MVVHAGLTSARTDRGPGPDPGSGDSRHPVRRLIVQDMAARTRCGSPCRPEGGPAGGEGKPGPGSYAISVRDVTSTDGAATSLLATVLAMSECPAALMDLVSGRHEKRGDQGIPSTTAFTPSVNDQPSCKQPSWPHPMGC